MKKVEMTPRERILAAINHQKTDRLPLDYWGVPETTEKLYKFFNVSNDLELAKAMDIDLIIGVDASLIKPDRKNVWDVEMKRVPLLDGSGFYDEPVSRPLEDCDTIDEIEQVYEWPTTDLFDYSKVKEQCKYIRSQGYATRCGYISLTYFYQLLRGIEQMMMDFAAAPELAEYILFKINEFASAHTTNLLEAADGLADISEVTDDFGCQIGLLVSSDMIENYLGKYYESNVSLIKGFDAKVFHHNCGAIQSIVPWIVGKGCDVLNPLQWHLPGWDLKELKAEFGNDISFHGGIDNQYVLPFGSKAEIEAEVRACIDSLFIDNTGYVLAPCHCIQANTSLENILTMYEYARAYES